MNPWLRVFFFIIMKQNDLLTGCLCAIGCETIFGMSYIFTKQAVDTASMLSLLGWRFFTAFFIMNLLIIPGKYFLGVPNIRLKGKDLKPLLCIVICSPVIYFIGKQLALSTQLRPRAAFSLPAYPLLPSSPQQQFYTKNQCRYK